VADAYILEVVNNDNEQVVGSEKGTAYHMSQVVQDILESLPENHCVIIRKE